MTPPPAAAKWYYTSESGTAGPVSHAELLQFVSLGTSTAGSVVWQEGIREWQAIGGRELATRGLRYSKIWRRVATELFDVTILQMIPLGLFFVLIAYVHPSGQFPEHYVNWHQILLHLFVFTDNSSDDVIFIMAGITHCTLSWLYFAAFESSPMQATLGWQSN